jgi:hypothetical protein
MHTLNQLSTCKCCKAKLNAVTGMNCNTVPKTGDITICANCGNTAKFDAQMNLEPLNDTELKQLQKQSPIDYFQFIHVATILKNRFAKNN